ncbi:bacteriophage abortive infection AbiH family protein [Pelobium sp.]|nr:AbiH family protein [Pelobium sp.]MDA9554910.1 bacteriophage abortive infection AbiH family protein [Pelobium sp.]
MNRLILVGNGFDLAHGLKTQYKDYILKYWESVKRSNHQDDFFRFEGKGLDFSNCRTLKDVIEQFQNDGIILGPDLLRSYFINYYKYRDSIYIEVLNNFFHHLNEIHSELNWVDIEIEYYKILKKLMNQSISEDVKKKQIKKLNDEISSITNDFELYLKSYVLNESENKRMPQLEDVFLNETLEELDLNRFFNEFPKSFVDKKLDSEYQLLKRNAPKTLKFLETHILNFNYTNTINKYFNQTTSARAVINNIHGKINDSSNPINLGFGDERDKFYSEIEDANENEYLRFMKSFYYSNTNNYKKLFDFLEKGEFQIQIMGHSCGLSDRTLLNSLFEHHNCISIKVFYHKFKNIDENGNEDNYSDIVKNISRHFNQKAMMRSKIVDKTLCEPLPQFE